MEIVSIFLMVPLSIWFLGVIGCDPISIDNAIPTDVTTCYGDSTGSIQVSASGGFGAPWNYSIDNGETLLRKI